MNRSGGGASRMNSQANWLWILLLAFIGLSPASQVRADRTPLPLEAFWNLVEETRQAATDAEGLPPDQAAAHLIPLARRWEGFSQVSLPDGSTLQVDSSFLLTQLRADHPDVSGLEKLLDTLLAAAHTPPQAAFTAQDLQTLQVVLARPEFQWQPDQLSPLEKWWQRMRELFWQWLGRLLSRAAGGRAPSILGYVFSAAGLLALFLVLVYFLRNLVANVVAESELAPAGEGGDEELTASSALQKAQGFSGAGDYRAAVRYLYLSSLLLLEERGLLPYDRSRTNREYLRSLAHLPALAAHLRDVVEVFDRVWYGYQPLDETAYDRYQKRVEELQQQK